MGEQAGRKPGSQRRDRPIRLILLSGLVSVLFHLLCIWPLQSELDSLRKQERDLNTLLSQKGSNSMALSQSIQSLNRARTRLSQVQTALARRDAPSILDQIQQLARNSDLEIKSFVPLERVSGRFYQERPCRLSLEGRFHNLGRFLEEVGNCEQIINVTNIVIRGEAGNPSPGISLQARMTASTFVLPDPGSAPEEETD